LNFSCERIVLSMRQDLRERPSQLDRINRIVFSAFPPARQCHACRRLGCMQCQATCPPLPCMPALWLPCERGVGRRVAGGSRARPALRGLPARALQWQAGLAEADGPLRRGGRGRKAEITRSVKSCQSCLMSQAKFIPFFIGKRGERTGGNVLCGSGEIPATAAAPWQVQSMCYFNLATSFIPLIHYSNCERSELACRDVLIGSRNNRIFMAIMALANKALPIFDFQKVLKRKIRYHGS